MPLCLLTSVADMLLGEPPNRLHPTVWMGALVASLEKILYMNSTKWRTRLQGVLLVVGAIFPVACLGWGMQYFILLKVPAPFSWLLLAAIASLAIACRSLAGHALPVLCELCAFKTQAARRSVSMIVGRDTQNLGRGEVSRAAVEAVAESLGDGIVAPLFWLAVLGLPGAFVYRISNTMDSMIGHKDERYIHFGWAAARFDDLLNYIPTRLIAVPAMLFAAFFIKGAKAAKDAIIAAIRFHGSHKSPNAGWYESFFAGALGIRLGGVNYYCCERCDYPLMNPAGRPSRPHDLKSSIRIMLASTFLAAIFLDAIFILTVIILKY